MMTISDELSQLADLFRLLGDPTRLRIVASCIDAPISVGEIALSNALSGSLVSHHLRLLRGARIVKAERHGKQIYYSAVDRHISAMIKDMLEHIAEPFSEID